MPKASVKKFIECKKKQLIDLVLDIEKYPEFVPFCMDAKVHEKKEKGKLLLIVGDLTIGKGPFIDTYKSNVTYNKKEDSIFVTNLDGPLKYLENTWHFKEENNITEVFFEVDFELKNDFLNIIMTTSFQFALDKIAEAFQKRADDLFKKT
jgi:coenzyme Q-binding protein COQ10